MSVLQKIILGEGRRAPRADHFQLGRCGAASRAVLIDWLRALLVYVCGRVS